jgi:hypothetical protein
VINIREPDETQLPLVKSFGEQLERSIANRAPSRRRSQRRALGIAFAAGLVGVSLLTSPGRAATVAVGEWLGLAEPGDPPTVEGPRGRGYLQTQPISSTLLSAGRAPDGARYEFVFERIPDSAESDLPGEGIWQCLNIEWPDARVGPISPQFGCRPTFPADVLGEAILKPGGPRFDSILTSHVYIAGLARSDVREVRVLYTDELGAKRDAPVDLAQVTGALREQVGADGPFGVFIGFLPQAWLGYGALYDPRHCPPEERPYDPQAIEVIAYDHQGEPIARETGNNITSVGGRPPCP